MAAVRVLVLVLLAWAGGVTDGVSYLALGQVLTANMTGNTVLLGVGIVLGDGPHVARSACALGSFCLGVAIGTLICGDARHGGRWLPSANLALALEAVVLIALAVAGRLIGHGGDNVYWLIALSGVAMGLQSAAVRDVARVTTTYITGTITDVVMGSIGRLSRPSTEHSHTLGQLRVGALIWPAYLGAAVAGAAAERAWGMAAVGIAAVAVIVAAAAATWRRPAMDVATSDADSRLRRDHAGSC